jgi:MFS transporter, DHA2 family, multidrug resistance protein
MTMPHGKYRIVAFKDFVPDRLRFIILLLTVFVFQFSNAIYLTNLNELVGEKGLTVEDVKLISNATIIGITMIFPLLFRIKFRFTSRHILITCAAMIIIGNVINMYSSNLIVLIITSLFVGIFKMIGTFECFSSVQLVLTPKRDFSVFFPVVYLYVLGSIQLSGILTAQISYLYNWKYMFIAIISLQLCVMITHYFLMRPIRMMKKIPLYQIDWLGMGLWSFWLLTLSFIFEYGKRLDWFHSEYICLAIITAIVLFYCAVQRMFRIRRPFIMPEAFKYKTLLVALFLFALLQILLSSSNVFMNVYTAGILHYDILNNSSLNWAVFAGIAVGSAASYYWLSIFKGGYKPILWVGFLCLALVHLILYFKFSPSLAKEDLYLPYVLRGLGYVALYISLTVYVSDEVPFSHFFVGLTLLGFVRSATGVTVANSLCTNILEYLQKKNMMILSQDIDSLNPLSNILYQNTLRGSIASGHSVEQAKLIATNMLYNRAYMQSMLLSWKEISGSLFIFGVMVLMGILLSHYIKPSSHIFPKFRSIWKYVWGKEYLQN